MNKVFLTAALAVIMILAAAFLTAAEHENNYNETQAFGMHFGNISGNGYAYRIFLDNLGFQFVVGGFTAGSNNYSFPPRIIRYDETNPPLTLTDTDNGRRYNFNIGANAIFPLKRTENFLFYAHTGLCWLYSDQKKYSQLYSHDSTSTWYSYYSPVGAVNTSNKIKSYVNIGVGPGVEMQLGKYFKIALELPITYTGQRELIMYIPQAGIYYYFR